MRDARPRPRFDHRTLWLLACFAAVWWAVAQSGALDGHVVNRGGWPLAWEFARAALHPDLSGDLLALMLRSTLTTVAFAVVGTALSVVIGGIFGVLGSEVWWQLMFPASRHGARGALVVRTLLAIPRAIHEVIWGLFLLNIFGLDPLVSVLALAIPFGAITARIFATILDETPRQAVHALVAAGAGPGKAMLYGLLPQALPDLLSYAFYRLECAIRAATVLGLIGAGGLGYQIWLSLQALHYDQVWTFLFALIALSALVDSWSSLLRQRIVGGELLAGPITTACAPQTRSVLLAPARRRSLQAMLVVVPLAAWYLHADLGKLWAPRTFDLLTGVLHAAFPPRLDPGSVTELLHLSAETLAMSILAIAGAGLGGMLLSLPAAANLMLDPERVASPLRTAMATAIRIASRGVLLLARSLSEAIWALIALFFLFPGILPGALGLAMYNLGILGRLMAEVTENVDPRPVRALQAQGASIGQVFAYGVLPVALPRCLAYVLYRWEVCIRATVMVGFVGAGGLGRRLTEQLGSFDYRGVTASLLAILALTFAVDAVSASLRRSGVIGSGQVPT